MLDEFAHLIRQAAQQDAGDYRPHVFGHIASYDPLLHRVRCMIPSMSDEDGSVLLSPWMQLGVPFGSTGSGFQYIYKGGATVDNPTGGEQVLISVFDKARGVAAVPCMFYNPNSRPPATNLPKQQDQKYPANAAPISGGDLLISAPNADNTQPNSMIRLRSNGDVEIWGAGNLIANIVGAATVTAVNGDINAVASQGNVNVTANDQVTVTAPTTLVQGNLIVSGEITAGFGTGDSVTLQKHKHGTGTAVAGTSVPSPGT